MDRMNPLDAEFLYLEDGTAHMHIASCAVFEGPEPPYDDLIALFASKLPLVPRYRQRVRFVPMDLGHPVWVDDPHFNLDYHVRHTALPAPGDKAALCRLMGRLMSQELDRDRPLWETWIVGGLAGGRWAAVSKVHHSMVDGVAGVDLVAAVLDLDREPTQTAVADDWEAQPEPSGLQLALDAALELVTAPRRLLGETWTAIRAPRRTLERGWTIASGLRRYGSALLPTPRTSLDGRIGPHRRWTFTGASLADVRTIRRAFGGTVNDVVLAAVTSGFRDLIAARGEDPHHVALRTLVPVSVRDETGHGVYDNRVSAIFLDLPVQLEDPLERLRTVHEQMDHLKQSHEPEAGEALTRLAAAVPPTFTARATHLAARLMTHVPQRTMNTVTTNVPGPQFPLYAAGREMLEYLPFVPLGPGVRIGVAILSYNGHLRFGVTGDYDTAPDIDVLANGVDGAVKTLLRLARRPHRRDGQRSDRRPRAARSATKPAPVRASR